MEYSGIEIEESGLIPPDKPCPFCEGSACDKCSSVDDEQIPGRLYPNSNRKGYCAGSDWAVQIL